jgi:hypothetical protein
VVTKLRVGQKVVALRPLWHPSLGVCAEPGQVGEVVGVGADAAFGYVQVTFEGMEPGTGLLTSVSPVTKFDPMAKVVEA